MSYLYVDTSILASILCQQRGYELFFDILSTARGVFSSNLIEAELFSVGRREKIIHEKTMVLLSSVEIYFPCDSFQRYYHQIFQDNHCSGADAYHIACALDLDAKKNELKFLTADKNQAFVAKKAGLQPLNDPRLKRFLKF